MSASRGLRQTKPIGVGAVVGRNLVEDLFEHHARRPVERACRLAGIHHDPWNVEPSNDAGRFDGALAEFIGAPAAELPQRNHALYSAADGPYTAVADLGTLHLPVHQFHQIGRMERVANLMSRAAEAEVLQRPA